MTHDEAIGSLMIDKVWICLDAFVSEASVLWDFFLFDTFCWVPLSKTFNEKL